VDDEFTVVFPDRIGSGRVYRCRFPWVANKQLRAYLQEPALKEQGLVGFALRCKMYNSKKELVRLTYTPRKGDFVAIIPNGGTR
jgi:hypothetical protein